MQYPKPCSTTRKVLQDLPRLIGKTIAKAELLGFEEYDDAGELELTFSDGTQASIVGTYEEVYTGNSQSEYPDRLFVYLDGEDQIKQEE